MSFSLFPRLSSKPSVLNAGPLCISTAAVRHANKSSALLAVARTGDVQVQGPAGCRIVHDDVLTNDQEDFYLLVSSQFAQALLVLAQRTRRALATTSRSVLSSI